MTEPATAPAPSALPTGERSLLPDILRGFALVGIALINIQDFAGFEVWKQVGVDRVVQIFTDLFFNGKSVALFAILFGWGAAGLWQRHGKKIYSVRHGLLAIIGMLHFLFLWHGDIIFGYAVTGLLFMPFLPKLNKKFPHWMWLPLILFVLFMLLSALGFMAGLDEPERQLLINPLDDVNSYASFVEHQLEELNGHISNVLFLPLMTLPYFALGAWLQQNEILSKPQENKIKLQQMLTWGLILGVPSTLMLALLNTMPTMGMAMMSELFRVFSGMPLALAYISLFALWTMKNPEHPVLKALANNGRLALTHYIGQTIIFTLIFYPYGLGLYGQWNATAAVALAAVVALLQVAISGVYLQRFDRGPLENLLRKGVYFFK